MGLLGRRSGVLVPPESSAALGAAGLMTSGKYGVLGRFVQGHVTIAPRPPHSRDTVLSILLTSRLQVRDLSLRSEGASAIRCCHLASKWFT